MDEDDEEDEGQDSGEERKRRKRKRRQEREEEALLDEEDLDLIGENIGESKQPEKVRKQTTPHSSLLQYTNRYG